MKRLLVLISMLALLATSLQAQIVGANERGRESLNSSERTLRGHYLRLEAGFPNFITAAYGYQITPWIFVGAGGGFGMITYDIYHSHYDYNYSYNDYSRSYKRLGLGLPVYTEFIFSTPKRNAAFFADLKIGYNIPLQNFYDYDYGSFYSNYYSRYGRRFYSCVNLGVKWVNFGLFGGITTNSGNMLFSTGFFYNIPLNVY